jgi:hypothetical protein
MTEVAPTASDLHGGQMSPEQALSTIEALKTSTAFGKLLLTKVGFGETAAPEVLAAKSRWSNLHSIAFPKPQEYSPDQLKNLPQHHDMRRQAEMNGAHGMQMLAEGYSPIQVHQILGGRPVSAEEHEFHERSHEASKKDIALMQRWARGDRDARLKISLHVSGRALPIAKSLAEIEAWDRQHPFPGTR